MVGSDYKLEWLGPFSDLYEEKHKGSDLEIKRNVIRIYILTVFCFTFWHFFLWSSMNITFFYFNYLISHV